MNHDAGGGCPSAPGVRMRVLDVRRCLTAAAVVVAVLAGTAGCGGDGNATVPTASELASSLLLVGDLPGEWSVNPGPDDGAVASSGVVDEAQQEMLPRLDFCDAASAEARATAEALRWQAFRQLDLAAADPIDPPFDRTGHLTFVQEFLTAGEPATISATFDALRAGAQACMGEIPAGEEGPGTASDLAVPALGDARFGVRTVIEEAGGGAEWIIQNVLVRRGAVLLMLGVVDICMGDVEPLYDAEAVGAMVRTAVARL